MNPMDYTPEEQLAMLENFLERHPNAYEMENKLKGMCVITGQDFMNAKLTLKFRRGTSLCGINNVIWRVLEINHDDVRRVRAQGKLHKMVDIAAAFIDRHLQEKCEVGPKCITSSSVDALAFASRAEEWLIGMYAEQDDADFRNMRDNTVRWGNMLSVTEYR